MSTYHYLSPPWFTRVRSIIAEQDRHRDSTPARLVIEHQLTRGTIHHQLFEADRLVSWRAGPAPNPDLVVHRSHQADVEDLLARGSPEDACDRTRFGTTDLSGGPTDVLAVQGVVQRRVPGATGLECRCSLRLLDSPFGHLAATLVSRSSEFALHGGVCRDPHVVIEAAYREVMDWIHGSILLGYLITAGRRVEGDVFRLSALEGIISSPPVERGTPSLIATLIGYCDARSGSLEVFDAIDEITA